MTTLGVDARGLLDVRGRWHVISTPSKVRSASQRPCAASNSMYSRPSTSRDPWTRAVAPRVYGGAHAGWRRCRGGSCARCRGGSCARFRVGRERLWPDPCRWPSSRRFVLHRTARDLMPGGRPRRRRGLGADERADERAAQERVVGSPQPSP